ncbi:MAG TPA: 3-oxoadipate enol-lactonase [Chryseolinea sp.]|nr:3-oxoadipate enol-lactonase [Chryseolinea sp.]
MDLINCNGITIHYHWINSDKDKTFVLINSLGTDFRIWDDVAKALQPFGNILRFDNRGHGLSDVVVDTRGLDDYAIDTLTLLEKLAIRKCIVIGLSIGGMIAQVMSYKTSGLIERLVLCDTQFKIGTRQFWDERIDAVNKGGLHSISNSVMERWFSEDFRNSEPYRVAGYRNMLERTPVIGYVRACEAIRSADLTDMAKQLKIPTLCIVGAEDKSTTPEDVKSLSDLIAGSRYEVIERSAHIPCVDNPAILNKLILDFIS